MDLVITVIIIIINNNNNNKLCSTGPQNPSH